jgi:hypothetical protein
MKPERPARKDIMDFPTIGQIITVNFDVEVEQEDGSILRLEAGEEMTVTGYDDLAGRDMTPEQYFAEFEAIEVLVELGDVHVQDMWDRSGQSDYEVSGVTTALSLSEDSGLKIIR